jgi:molecular chaperone GrpE
MLFIKATQEHFMSKDKPKNWKAFKENHEEDLEKELIEDENDQDDEEENVSALDHPSYKKLEEKLTLTEQQAHETWEKLVRTNAELENVRRRAAIDVLDARKYGVKDLVLSLLPVMDSIEQGLQLADKETHGSMYEGLELTRKLLLTTLEKQEVKQIDPMGMPFDPQEHEAMSMQETDEAAPNTVLIVFQKGYKLADRIIRPARVIVAKAKS